MRKGIAFAAVAALTALALFLPEWLSGLHDKQLLDSLSIHIQDEAQEGFAESIQLSTAEKVMLLRSGSLTVMDLDHSQTEVAYAILPAPDDGGPEASASSGIPAVGVTLIETGGFSYVNLSELPPELIASSEAEISSYTEEVSLLWQTRLEEMQGELRSLQAAGGLPELWSENSELHCSGRGDVLYMDPDTKMSFQVYRALLEGGAYTIDLTVDVQSKRILSFHLRWGKGVTPNWGLRGASNFGGVWRNYWGLDSVSGGWYNEYNKSILEQTEDSYWINGDYDAHGQIAFTYDGQTLPVPLECEAYSGRSFSIKWNT